MKRTFQFFVALFVIFTIMTGVSQAIEGMVTRVEPNGNVVINKGINAQVQPQTVYYVIRMGKPIAKIKVVQVDDYSSICQVVEPVGGNRPQVGDLFSDSEFTKIEMETTPTASETGTKSDKMKSEAEIAKENEKARQEAQKKATQDFENVVKKKTQIIQFKRGAGGTIKINVFETYNFLSTIIFAGQCACVNPWYAGMYAYGAYADYKSSMNPERIRNVQMEITFWDMEYLDAYATYYGYKEVITDPKKIQMVKENIYRQKGLDKFYVFQVKLINPGPGAFQLAPFPWHFYLEGKGGVRLKADHYDEVLDKAMNPNQVVNGYIYFSRYDQSGQPVLEGKGVTVILEDILGNGRKLHFD